MKVPMRSVRTRLIYSFMSVIIISIFIFIAMLSIFLKEYYYKGVEDILTNQIRTSASFYSRYFSDSSLQDNITDNVDVFWKLTSAQVQIIDQSGNVLMDSIGVKFNEKLDTVDFRRAIQGQTGKWIGRVGYTDETVMAVAHPLEVSGKVVGVLRFIISLDPTHRQIKEVTNGFITIGLLAIGISIIISMILAKGIVGPIKEVTKVAERMAQGDFEVRSEKKSNDEVGKLSDTLNYLAEEIVKKEQIKNEFIASVSHELRTPLTSIKGWAIILNTTNPEEREIFNDGLKIIEKEAERLSTMVEDLLDFSKLLSGKMTFQMGKTDIGSVIEYIKRHMTPAANRKSIKFLVEYPEEMPIINADANRIKQVLINVLDNALKFTEQDGWVQFTTYVEGHSLVMVIQDNGCGISPLELTNVKKKFFKGKNSKSSSGIGLSVADEIIGRHRGSLDIESEEGQGTKVTIVLPIES